MLPPKLTSTRLILAPATRSDLDSLWRLWRARDVRRYLFDDKEVTRELASGILDNALAQSDQGLGLWTVTARNGTEIIGCAGLLRVSEAGVYNAHIAGETEPLVALASSHWRQGYAVETLRLLVAYARDTLALARLVAVSDVPNIASGRMLQRVGFMPTERTPGPAHPLQHYELDLRVSATTRTAEPAPN